ncbi:MAG: UbiX family flavin prenyltransferase [Candidatus Thiodiazotropha taylori]|uniref:Flavin prenyltransferase UbiX n=1 Tax=Candidatus Thiodiazotropha taylori TaxID=2792791 RepID=A0A9E4P4P9_9GAMM|nr:UbiX family flavin prenyltransferase [Candidatus Thiodiazotropha taylori]RLW67480.1 MAG: aromatic acid decarboxylase [gamma proteobacterium symbiont of Stewartia floridana]MCG7948624.1 UbiX family flavin prenyltransferase [Candidatus Thiodiazotropha taylori]MCG7966493.1 UbiX family flavin prenyltransferase [Candidatus Thiodiazotropha taylori]MCG8029679.1 UbiX family flavin prenyltransferase [Candidatus Thiodiazotropha taylori]
MSIETNPIAVAITGASGSAYALRLIESLLQAGEPLYLMVSQAAQVVLRMESGLELPSQPGEIQKILCERFNVSTEQLQVFGRQQWMAPVASGSNPPRAMVVCPCTVGALSAIACGASNDLMERAADVVLKERRKLILVVRETPFSEIHLENMLKLSRLGAVIMPANPGFYHNPQRVEDIVDFMVSRILDQLGVENRLSPRWGE